LPDLEKFVNFKIKNMAKSVPCRFCGQPATTHLTQIIDKKVAKVDICQACAQKQALEGLSGLTFAAALGKQIFMEGLKAIFQGLRCPHCECTIEQFRQTGHLGCPHCYGVFRAVLEPMLKDTQMNIQHKGKTAKATMASSQIKQQLSLLEAALKKAIDEERFEDAAKMRDEIKALKEEPAKREA